MRRLVIAAGVAGLAAIGGMAAAQDQSTNQVAAETDWSVFVEDNPTECWGVSAPKETVNTRDGRVVSVRRGDILLFVTFRPGRGAAGEVSFTGGYPFRNGSTVTVTVSGNDYDLYTEGEWAWPEDAQSDSELVAALRAGAEATVVGVSSRGTTTQDTFSLMGFTAAMEEAEKRCSE